MVYQVAYLFKLQFYTFLVTLVLCTHFINEFGPSSRNWVTYHSLMFYVHYTGIKTNMKCRTGTGENCPEQRGFQYSEV